jgi:hypothetical protein
MMPSAIGSEKECDKADAARAASVRVFGDPV